MRKRKREEGQNQVVGKEKQKGSGMKEEEREGWNIRGGAEERGEEEDGMEK